MIIIKISILYFIQIRHTNDFLSTGTRLVSIMYNGASLEQVKQFIYIYIGPSFNEKGDTINVVKR